MFQKLRLLPAIIVGIWATTYGCANDDVRLGNTPVDDAGPGTPSLVPPAMDGGDSSVAPQHVLACVGTECPAPYATCSDQPSLKCQNNLLTDVDNCGACGAKCADYSATNMVAQCVGGACQVECISLDQGGSHQFANCNGLLDDGCESDLSTDHDNCGVCGHACGAAEHCIDGMCGCPSGKTDCDGTCVDTNTDNSNCGMCANNCANQPASGGAGGLIPIKPPGGGDPCGTAPPHTTRSCNAGMCAQLLCSTGYGDCDHDLALGCASNGCETQTATDPNNCGACGRKCAAGQECRDDGSGPQCLGSCESAGLTQCSFGCSDLLSDPKNCGACGNNCRGPADHQTSTCDNGLCRIDCLPGYGDCNGDPSDGCEVDLRSNPASCGTCGNACDFGAGQPCIDGKCLMVECDAGATK